jgi:hypothetical protein
VVFARWIQSTFGRRLVLHQHASSLAATRRRYKCFLPDARRVGAAVCGLGSSTPRRRVMIISHWRTMLASLDHTL